MSKEDTQTWKIQQELMKASDEFPNTPKNEIITLVLARMNLPNTSRPAVRRAKGMMLRKFQEYIMRLK